MDERSSKPRKYNSKKSAEDRRGGRPADHKDPNQIAFNVVQQAIGEAPKVVPEPPKKNPAAVTLGRLGGLKGGKARAEKLSAAKRAEIAKKAAKTRWAARVKE
jgi:hypothetical protein